MSSNVPEMTCEECEDLLPLVADGVLDEADEPALFHHLARCPRCQASLAVYDRIDLLLAEPAEPVEPPLTWGPWLQRAGGLLVAAALLVAGGFLSLRGPTFGGGSTGTSSSVLRVVEAENGDEALLVQHPDGRVEVIDELDQPRSRAESRPEDELRPATTTTTQRDAWRPAHR